MLQFLVDPGSAVVVIPRAALSQLVANGTVSEDDVVGVSVYGQLADRSLYRRREIRLRELRVGNEVARDVIAAEVSPGLSHPLLGQTFLRRFASVTIDNQRRTLILSGAGMASRVLPIRVGRGLRNTPRRRPHPITRRRRARPTAAPARRLTGRAEPQPAAPRRAFAEKRKPRGERGAFASCEAVGLVPVIVPMTPRPLVAAAVITVIPAPVVAPAVRHATAPWLG